MQNDKFQKLVSILEQDIGLLHNFIFGEASNQKLQELLSELGRANTSNASKDTKLAKVLLAAECTRAQRAAAFEACVDSCEASAADSFSDSLNGHDSPPIGLPHSTSACTDNTWPATLNVTEFVFALTELTRIDSQQMEVDLAVFQRSGVSCGPNYTCSCTSGTCGGPTCGGSTCDATCTGDSCGSTCGTSCGWTSSLTQDVSQLALPWQVSRWR